MKNHPFSRPVCMPKAKDLKHSKKSISKTVTIDRSKNIDGLSPS